MGEADFFAPFSGPQSVLVAAAAARMVQCGLRPEDVPALYEQMMQRAMAAPPAGGEICPSCGQWPLAPVYNQEGLVIVGCRRCRYSEVR